MAVSWAPPSDALTETSNGLHSIQGCRLLLTPERLGVLSRSQLAVQKCHQLRLGHRPYFLSRHRTLVEYH